MRQRNPHKEAGTKAELRNPGEAGEPEGKGSESQVKPVNRKQRRRKCRQSRKAGSKAGEIPGKSKENQEKTWAKSSCIAKCSML